LAELLFLAQRIPWPLDKGEKIRAGKALQHLARDRTVHLGCLVDDPNDWQHTSFLKSLCGETFFGRRDARLGKMAALSGLLTGEPLSVRYFWHAALARWVRDLLARRKIDAIFLSSSPMAKYVLGDANAPRPIVMDFVDVDSDKWRQYAKTHGGPMRWIYERECRRLLEFDRQVGARTDWSVFVSEAETALFKDLAPELRDKAVEVRNGVDHAYFSPAERFEPPYDPASPAVVFTGTMSYWPNVDAAVWFAKEILPKARALVPELRFYIVGSSPSPAVASLAAEPGVVVTGRVPDVRPYLAHAAAAVVPLRIANGVQNKVLEAMAMEKIVIAAPKALTGVECAPGEELLAAEEPEAFARAIADAVAGRFAGMGHRARKAVMERYDWDTNLLGYERLLSRQRPRESAASPRRDALVE
jgi:sugar transferase (PEP-CTERM/EpsH1 system associated)